MTWSAEIRDRKAYYNGGQLHPGDIVLLHFRPETYDELVMLFGDMDRLGLHAAPLQDYIGPEATRPRVPAPTTLPAPSAPSPAPTPE